MKIFKWIEDTWKKYPCWVQEVFLGVIAFIIALITFQMVKWFLPDMKLWHLYVCTLVISALFLGIFRAVQKEGTKLGDGVTVALILFFIFGMVTSYLKKDDAPMERWESETATVQQKEIWFTDHEFSVGEDITYYVSYSPVFERVNDKDYVLRWPGSYKAKIKQAGKIIFKGADSRSKIKIEFKTK